MAAGSGEEEVDAGGHEAAADGGGGSSAALLAPDAFKADAGGTGDAGEAAADAALEATSCTVTVYCREPSATKSIVGPCLDEAGVSADRATSCNWYCDAGGYYYGAGCSYQANYLDAGPWVTCCFSGGGRRAGGCTVPPARSSTALGAYFANLAYLEALSVPAFALLSAELAMHGAPEALVSRARTAIADEELHTRITSALAGRFGGVPAAPSFPALAPRSLLDVAVENAVEGCVRETFGALLAIYQAQRADDAEVRRAMRRIAEDESHHAELSWDVAVFCDGRLDEEGRLAVRDAMAAALAALRTELEQPAPGDVQKTAGMPSPEEAVALWRCLADVLPAPVRAAA